MIVTFLEVTVTVSFFGVVRFLLVATRPSMVSFEASVIFAFAFILLLILLCVVVADFVFGLTKYPSGHVFRRRGGFLGLDDPLEGGTASQTLWYCFCAYVSDFPGGGGVKRTFLCSGSSEEERFVEVEAFFEVGSTPSTLGSLETELSFSIFRRFSAGRLSLLLLLLAILFFAGVSIFPDLIGVGFGLGDVFVFRNFFFGAGVDAAPSCMMLGFSVVTIFIILSQNRCLLLHLSHTESPSSGKRKAII
mmetsp:Transcript_23980/g.26955  ORF Transcript_23980/g.26955 Transcript_23980/m.26955 type:complete len:248 (-) Transcript_23980:704-1447(-)